MSVKLNHILKRIRYEKASRIGEVPPEPGTVPIPENHVRLYHFTDSGEGRYNEDQMVDNLRKKGIDIGQAKGVNYGQPNMVWASTKLPRRFKVFAEFSIHKDDPRWDIGKPKTQEDIDQLYRTGSDVTFNGSIQPHEIMAVHAPWHGEYRSFVEENAIPEVLSGKYDYMLDDPRHPDTAKAIAYIKARHGESINS